MELEESLAGGVSALGLTASAGQISALAAFLRLLEKWNRVYNLTAVRELSDMVAKHVLDSLTVLPYLHGVSVLDVGTGAGLPGIPLAIMQPQRQFTLLDSAGKKIRFVRHVAAELRLENVLTEEQRAEDYTPPEPFDTVICRAFAPLRDFVQCCGSLAAPGGRLLAMKGRFPEPELSVLPTDWSAADVEAVRIPGLDVQRHVIVMERITAHAS